MSNDHRYKYVRHFFETNHAPNVPKEQIINELIEYNNKNGKYHATLYSFNEFVENENRRIDLTFINTNAISGKHYHDFYELIYVFEGKIIQIINEESFTMTDGTLLVLHPSTVHSFYCYKKTKAVNIIVKKEYLERFLSTINARLPNCYINRIADGKNCSLFKADKKNNILEPLVKQLCKLSEMGDFQKGILGVKNEAQNLIVDTLMSEQLLHQLLLTIIKGTESKLITEKQISVEKLSHDSESIIEYIREHYANVTVELLSKKFGYSTAQIYRIIKHATGNNFSSIVMQTRVIRSKYLLRNTDFEVSQIAKMVGVDSSEYFCRMFKNTVGYTPTQYRSNHNAKKYMPNDMNIEFFKKDKK